MVCLFCVQLDSIRMHIRFLFFMVKMKINIFLFLLMQNFIELYELHVLIPC